MIPVNFQVLLCFLVTEPLLLPCSVVHGHDPFPPELTTFTPLTENPVFTAEPGQWDSKIRERGWIMKEGDLWRMWYTGYNEAELPLTMKLGYATSSDGIHWTRHSQNPIIDDLWVEDVMIVKHGGTYWMFAEGAGDQSQLLKSSDGVRWERVGTLDVRLSNGASIPPGPYGTPTAWFENGKWFLFYERRDQGIWLATSTDMKVWTNVSDEPLIVPGPENYDGLMIAMNQIIRHGGRYYAVLHGSGSPAKPRDWCTYIAVSDDLQHWDKNPSGPLLPIKDNRSSGMFVYDDGRFRLYTMHGRVDLSVGVPVKRQQ